MVPGARAISLSYTSYPTIDINSEADLHAFPAKSGSGTDADPYVISNLAINAPPWATGIYIRNTFTRLRIQNCLITGSALDPVGIFLKNCSNIEISGCILQTLYCGIQIIRTNNSYFASNTLSNLSRYGLDVEDCRGLTIENNTISEAVVNGMVLVACSSGTISQNKVSGCGLAGINISAGSCDNYFVSNVLLSNGAGFSEHETAIFNKFLGNSVDGVQGVLILDVFSQHPGLTFLLACFVGLLMLYAFFRNKRGKTREDALKYFFLTYTIAGCISLVAFVMAPNITVYSSTPGYDGSDYYDFFHAGMAVDAGLTFAAIITSTVLFFTVVIRYRGWHASKEKPRYEPVD